MNKLKFLAMLPFLAGVSCAMQRDTQATSVTFDEALQRTAFGIENNHYDGFILSASARSTNERSVAADLALAETALVAAENGEWAYLNHNVQQINNSKIKRALISALQEADLPVGGAR